MKDLQNNFSRYILTQGGHTQSTTTNQSCTAALPEEWGGGGGGAGFTFVFFTHDIIPVSERRDTDLSKGRKAVVGQIRNCTDF
jgi:hypothetical protein